MKSSPSRRGIFLAVLAGSCLLPSVSNAANIIVGTGNDTSYLILESANLGVRTYEVHYTYNSTTPQDSAFLIAQAVAGDSALGVSLGNYPTVPFPVNYYVNYFALNSVEEWGSSSPPWTYWAHWVAGGAGYQNLDFSYNSGAAAADSWTLSYGISTHTIQPGSSDALYLSEGIAAPSVAPIPETSSALLAVLGSLVVLIRRRKN
jgi:hypothetical protein